MSSMNNNELKREGKNDGTSDLSVKETAIREQ